MAKASFQPTSVRERPLLFTGRAAELEALLAMLAADTPRIAWVHGLGGIGKSALLRALASAATVRGAHVVALDGETLEPTEAAFRREARAATAGGPVVVTIDAYERLRLLDDWLRRDGVPSLPANAHLVIASRDAPVATWIRDYGERLRRFPLEPLPPYHAHALLRELGMDDALARRVNRTLRGHPLALRLAASTALSDDRVLQPALDELAREHLDGMDPRARGVLDAAGVVRRMTRPLLEAMLPGESERFDALRQLPFVTRGRDGLIVHEVIRELVVAELRATDPVRHRRLRAAAWRHLREELEHAGEHELWRSTADMLYLIENPAVRDAFFPASSPQYSVEPAGEREWPAILAIGDAHEPAPGAVREWLRAVPDAFFVARDIYGEVAGFSAVTEPESVPVQVFDRDPVAAAWRRHMRAGPPAPGQRALLIRFMLSADSGSGRHSRNPPSIWTSSVTTSPCVPRCAASTRVHISCGRWSRCFGRSDSSRWGTMPATAPTATTSDRRPSTAGSRGWRPARSSAPPARPSTRSAASSYSATGASTSDGSNSACWAACTRGPAPSSGARSCCARSGARDGTATQTRSTPS